MDLDKTIRSSHQILAAIVPPMGVASESSHKITKSHPSIANKQALSPETTVKKEDNPVKKQ
jgi:hypothetical protein